MRKRLSELSKVDWCDPGWLLMHGAFLAVLGLVWVIDEPVARFANWWYNESGPINGELHQLILSLAMYGQMLGIVMSLLLILLFDTRRRGRILILGCMVLAGGLGSGLIKGIVGRERPLESGNRTIVHGPLQGLDSTGRQSFPSGHTATAFALSYGLSSFYPQTRWLVWPLAAGVGLNRVITVRHFPSDVVAGAWIGFMLAAWISQRKGVRKLAIGMHRWCRPRENGWMTHLSTETIAGLVKKTLTTPLLLFFVSICIHWAGNAATPLWDRDEPRFATATREMMQRGDWVVPTFNGELRPDKPILIYWLMGAAYNVFGDGPFAARFFSGLAGTLTCMVVYLLGRSMFNRHVGLLAGWMLALSPMLIVESKLATADAVLLCFLTMCFACVWVLYDRIDRSRQNGGKWKSFFPALAFWICLALAILVKGPVALGVLGAAIVCFCLFTRDGRWLRALRPGWGIPLALLILLPWCLLVHHATDGEFLRIALGHHVIKRSMQPLEGHRGFPGFYIVSLLGLMAPWAWMLPWSIREHWNRLFSDSRVAFLASWALGCLVLFELVTTKLVHYYLPAYPAIALFLASALCGRFAQSRLGAEAFDRRIGNVLLAVGSVLAVAIMALAITTFPSHAAVPAGIVVLVLGGGLAVAGILVRQLRLQRAFVVLTSTLAASMIVASCQLLPALGKERAVLHVAERMKQLEDEYPLALWLYRDPSIVYNLGRPLPVVDSMRSEPIFSDSLRLAAESGPFVCPMTPEHLQWMSQDGALKLEIVDTLERWDLKGLQERSIHFVKVQPSASMARVLQLQDELCDLMPKAEKVSFPSDRTSESQQRSYPVNPVVAKSKNNQVR